MGIISKENNQDPKKDEKEQDPKKNNEFVDYIRKRLKEEAEKKENESDASKVDNKALIREKVEQDLKKREEKVKSGVKKPITPRERQENIADPNRSIKDFKRVVEKKDEPQSVTKQVVKRLLIIALAIIIGIAAIVGGYLVYIVASYSRIVDVVSVKTENNRANTVVLNKTYSITTFNLGFGAYSADYSFFMDEGKMADGTKTKGKYSRGYSQEAVKNNISGAVNLVKSEAVSDFYFFQEVDTNSSRSYHVDQTQMLRESFENFDGGYGSAYAVNAHSKYLFYPLTQPIGSMNSGIMTFSKYTINYSIRRQLAVSSNLVDKLSDLDRCLMVTKIPVYGQKNKYLVLINLHLSAYDDGTVRMAQLETLYEIMKQEYVTNGNYVIVGGDFNLSLAGDKGKFENQMQTPDWVHNLPEKFETDFAELGFNINCDLSTTNGTCRDASVVYSQGTNFEVIIDGFMTSNNISVESISTIDGGFQYSDHNPVQMKFKLN